MCTNGRGFRAKWEIGDTGDAKEGKRAMERRVYKGFVECRFGCCYLIVSQSRKRLNEKVDMAIEDSTMHLDVFWC